MSYHSIMTAPGVEMQRALLSPVDQGKWLQSEMNDYVCGTRTAICTINFGLC
jgi:hypothetical protein